MGTSVTIQKLPKNVRDLGKLIVAKVQKIAQSGHTDGDPLLAGVRVHEHCRDSLLATRVEKGILVFVHLH